MGKTVVKHGMSDSPTYKSWRSMRDRCLNSKHTAYKKYGGRGISIWPAWLDIANFVADMGLRPDGTTLDRMDGNGNYEPGNCRWATRTEQNYNRKSNLTVVVDGESLKTNEVMARFGIPYQILTRRLREGWTGDQAAKTPWGIQGRVSGRVVKSKPI